MYLYPALQTCHQIVLDQNRRPFLVMFPAYSGVWYGPLSVVNGPDELGRARQTLVHGPHDLQFSGTVGLAKVMGTVVRLG